MYFQFDQFKKSRSLQTWYPHENEDDEFKCKLTCYSRDSQEYYQTGENVVDGTKCSYDRANDICVQGKCVALGCDMVCTIRWDTGDGKISIFMWGGAYAHTSSLVK